MAAGEARLGDEGGRLEPPRGRPGGGGWKERQMGWPLLLSLHWLWLQSIGEIRLVTPLST